MAELELDTGYYLLAIRRAGRYLYRPRAQVQLQSGDELIASGPEEGRAALAGLVLGVMENLTSLYWGNEWALAVDFVMFLMVLSFKPSGIFGTQKA